MVRMKKLAERPFYIYQAPPPPAIPERTVSEICAGVLKVVALLGMFAIAIIYDGTFMYIAVGAGLIVLGISIKQVLNYNRR